MAGLFNITPSFEGVQPPTYQPTQGSMFEGLGQTAKSAEFIKNLGNMFEWQNTQKEQGDEQFKQEFIQALPEEDRLTMEGMDPATQGFYMDLYMQGIQEPTGEQPQDFTPQTQAPLDLNVNF
jgi:hypothetical protein